MSYTIFLIMLVLLLLVIMRFFILNKYKPHLKLFVEARRNENNGHFEEAILEYETVLSEVKKIGLQNNSLKKVIIEKLKVLHTIIDYKKNIRFMR